MHKIVNTKQLGYFYDLIPHFQRSSRSKGCIYEPFIIRPIGDGTYEICDPLGIKLLTRLRFGFNYLSVFLFLGN